MATGGGAAVRRLQKESLELHSKPVPGIHGLKVDEKNFLSWEALVVPTKVPYNKGAFRFQIKFLEEYPFKPPTIVFKTQIYHPNIDEKGAVCLNIINAENWKPATRVAQVLESLVKLVNDPEPDHALRADLAKSFTTERAKFDKTAESCTKKFAEKRP